jgi:hypothetical protein
MRPFFMSKRVFDVCANVRNDFEYGILEVVVLDQGVSFAYLGDLLKFINFVVKFLYFSLQTLEP